MAKDLNTRWWRFEDVAPEVDSEVFVVCNDDSFHAAVYRGKSLRTGHYWTVYGPAGAPRRLQKNVAWWAYRHTLEEINNA